MTYAKDRIYLDADSHLMELPDFLTSHADPSVRERLPRINFESGGRSSDSLENAAKTGAHSSETVAELVALGDDLIAGPKGYLALGAFNKEERRSLRHAARAQQLQQLQRPLTTCETGL